MFCKFHFIFPTERLIFIRIILDLLFTQLGVAENLPSHKVTGTSIFSIFSVCQQVAWSLEEKFQNNLDCPTPNFCQHFLFEYTCRCLRDTRLSKICSFPSFMKECNVKAGFLFLLLPIKYYS